MKDETLEDYLEKKNLYLCKDLTDEEINELWLVTCSKAGEVDDMELHFVRAILRKAQEK